MSRSKYWWGFCGVLIALVLGGFSTVLAHADLVKAIPAPGATLSKPPRQIELTFSTALRGGTISLYNFETEITPTTLTPPPQTDMLVAQIDDVLPSGDYSVVWSTESLDGHTLSGSYTFAYHPTVPQSVFPYPLIAFSFFGLALLVGVGVIVFKHYRKI